MSYPGIGFPEKSELNYYSGRLDVLQVAAGGRNSSSMNDHIAFYDKKTRNIYEFVRSYENTVAIIKRDQKFSITFIFSTLLLSVFIYWFFGRQPKD